MNDAFGVLKMDMKSYYEKLNNESIWLFIAAIGCLSIP